MIGIAGEYQVTGNETVYQLFFGPVERFRRDLLKEAWLIMDEGFGRFQPEGGGIAASIDRFHIFLRGIGNVLFIIASYNAQCPVGPTFQLNMR